MIVTDYRNTLLCISLKMCARRQEKLTTRLTVSSVRGTHSLCSICVLYWPFSVSFLSNYTQQQVNIADWRSTDFFHRGREREHGNQKSTIQWRLKKKRMRIIVPQISADTILLLDFLLFSLFGIEKAVPDEINGRVLVINSKLAWVLSYDNQ